MQATQRFHAYASLVVYDKVTLTLSCLPTHGDKRYFFRVFFFGRNFDLSGQGLRFYSYCSVEVLFVPAYLSL